MAATLPPNTKVKLIDQKSPTWSLYHDAWDLMYLMYTSGVEMEAAAERFLRRRPKEMPDVYSERVAQFRAENHTNTAIDWYQAALFEKPPEMQPATATKNAASGTAPKSKYPDEYYDRLYLNADRANTPVIEVFRQYYRNLILFGRAIVLVDLPAAPKDGYPNAAEEKKAGQLDPFVVNYDPRQMINFAADAAGNMEWVVFKSCEQRTPSPFEPTQTVHCWYYFDRENFAVYEYTLKKDEKEPPADGLAELARFGRHALADDKVVPVIYDELPGGLWLMNRAFSPAKDYVNTNNVLGFALFMAALAMPVIAMDGEFVPALSESGFIKIPRDAKYSWSEPEGHSFQHLSDRAQALMEQVFRSFYLIAQSRTGKATPAQMSGISKEQDMRASKKILNLFGSVMRTAIQRAYNLISKVRGETLTWDVRGLEFPEDPPDETIQLATDAITLDVPSDLFEKEIMKMAVRAALPHANPTLIGQIEKEIDAAQPKAERDLQKMQDEAKTMAEAKLLTPQFGSKPGTVGGGARD